jgi:ATP-binding cassette, subfamily F, member 3
MREYAGNYGDYLHQYRQEREKQWSAWKDQEYEVRRMKQDIARAKTQAATTERLVKSVRLGGIKAGKDHYLRLAKKVAKKAKSREKKLDRYLDSDERVEKPLRSWQMKLALDEAPHLGKDVLFLEDLSIGYPGHAPLLQGITQQAQAGERIILTGANGLGKTTLLRTIAGQIAPVVGRVRLGHSVRLGYMAQEQESLDPQQTPLTTIQQIAPLNQTDARSFLHYFLFSGDDPLRPNHLLSYGERARLALASLVATGCNFLLLDEPINHLDIPSRTMFEQALAQFEGTILAVVHDRYFIEQFATKIWLVMRMGNWRWCIGDWDTIVANLDQEIPLITMIQAGELLHWQGELFQHAVVVIGYDDANVWLLDPAVPSSPIAVSMDEFMLAWGEMDYRYAVMKPERLA